LIKGADTGSIHLKVSTGTYEEEEETRQRKEKERRGEDVRN
jgi:hypothetical protein